MTDSARSVHVGAVNLTLKGHDAESAAAVARDLPDAIERRMNGRSSAPKTLTDQIAVQVAAQIDRRITQDDDGSGLGGEGGS